MVFLCCSSSLEEQQHSSLTGSLALCSASLLLPANIPISSSHHHPPAAASPANLIRATRFLTSSKWRIFAYSYPQLLCHTLAYPTISLGKRSPLSLLPTDCLQDQTSTLSWARPAGSPASTAAWHTLVSADISPSQQFLYPSHQQASPSPLGKALAPCLHRAQRLTHEAVL